MLVIIVIVVMVVMVISVTGDLLQSILTVVLGASHWWYKEGDFDQLLLSVVQGTKGTSTLAIEPDFKNVSFSHRAKPELEMWTWATSVSQ